ncbi:3-hydroxyacyl-CoA dehydrogenase NAD-binding domain-containing protein [Maritimibacter sp. HL-12]|uniref:3-hydroxyacyl-CoA dehydrogenase NAD-binding domain-containing protein n=1 Tax=Maritimibacter sp. HL-12 TaxID=1162418 RepID=UPI000A0EEB4B|nr:3-hydroxyacyl-CoA dehydrogenase NAD-binding domain-containing protein [Maritimibacter sp. HL-12]SMH51617.1 short chain enoyl-CoA hydratase /3-hydroxyacyl-CoA dehydrogenase [Maritimibacter sp. HL-12]
MPVTTRRDGATAHVTLDFPPVNAIGQETRAGLIAALDWIEAEAGLERVILSGAGRAFAAGADAREFDGPALEPHLPDVVARIEACEVPWIAAIRGPALGGGCELALACRYRIATPDAQIGLPEVTLGVVPGAGGTQRLPRLVGLKAALDMIATGKPVTGERALALRLVDEIADDPAFAAEEVNHELLSTVVAIGDLPGPETDAEALAAAKATAEARMRGQIAPHRAIDLVEMSTTTPLGEALQVERETFLKLRVGAQARALRHIFFAERGAKAPGWLKDTRPAEITRAVVVGGGTMGAGIAYALLNAGIFVDIIETDAEGVARAEANLENIVAASLKRGLITEAQAQARRAAFNATAEYAIAREADIAIEAAFESMEVKQAVFTRLQAAMRPDTLMATNTSYLDVNEIAAVLDDPTRLVGLHFFAPAHIMKLLEIVRGEATSDAALATGFALAKRLRKLPVLAGVCDGFIGNRILARYREAADTVMMDGSNPWEIDEAMVEFGYPMGPYEAQDLSGLDIAFANRRRQDVTRDPNRRYIPISDRMVNEGRLGKKAGVGWYRYPGGGGKVIDPLVEDLAREEAYFAKVERQAFSADEIRERLVLAMINEAAAILDEGIAQSAADIDVVTVAGYGFPRWRGGLMHHADTIGAGAILARLEAFAREDPVAWQPADLIRRLAARGGSFAGV